MDGQPPGDLPEEADRAGLRERELPDLQERPLDGPERALWQQTRSAWELQREIDTLEEEKALWKQQTQVLRSLAKIQAQLRALGELTGALGEQVMERGNETEAALWDLLKRDKEAHEQIDALNEQNAALSEQVTALNKQITHSRRGGRPPGADWDAYLEMGQLLCRLGMAKAEAQAALIRHIARIELQVELETVRRRVRAWDLDAPLGS